jgi:ABC-type Mn2+/Zn2+ transport system permease subunit
MLGLEFPFMQRALAAAILMGLVCPILGVFVVIRRMSFFGDAIGHSALTGIAIGLLLGIDPSLSAIGFAILIAIGMGWMQSKSRIPSDTIIGVFLAGSVAVGILLIGMMQGYRANLFTYLFGDILTVEWHDLVISGSLLLFVGLTVVLIRRPLLQIALNRDMATVQGVRVELLEYVLMILLAITVAVSIKLVGIILVTALLIIPAAAARNVSSSIRQMFIFAIVFGLFSAVAGLFGSYQFNAASGSTIVLTSIAIFLSSLIGQK